MKDLRSRSLRITDQFKPAPEVDQIENDTLEAREKVAWRRSEFWMVNDGDGTVRGGFRMPEAQADMLADAIRSLSAPKRDHLHQHPGATNEIGESVYDRDLEHRNRLGMGFAELAGHLPGNCLPGKGGLGPTLLVRLDHDTLIGGIKAATLSTGIRISASEARLMACNVGIIPQVFDGRSLPLDHGHEQRLFTKTQKQGQEARDGGETKLADGVLVCPFHHRTIHDGWAIRMSPVDGYPEYRAPGSETWRRNHRWRP